MLRKGLEVTEMINRHSNYVSEMEKFTVIEHYLARRSEIGRTASTRYYRVKRLDKEHLCDYLNRLNGYARNTNVKFENGCCEAKKHAKHSLKTCGYRDFFATIHYLEDIASDMQRVEKQVIRYDSGQHSCCNAEQRLLSSNSYELGRYDECHQEYENGGDECKGENSADYYSQGEEPSDECVRDYEEGYLVEHNDDERRKVANEMIA
ncbi:hypothetical protein PHMEG_00023612 [Phytophthora megakarya]|uniref:Uncharacterized protein n=1 Tax=Phytophthora megakarya TaxID=4795 RepID=A0A225VHN8_9STRA|nr:hypothetical protein PHMEG_00023612 [Phytophthora megakarya]